MKSSTGDDLAKEGELVDVAVLDLHATADTTAQIVVVIGLLVVEANV